MPTLGNYMNFIYVNLGFLSQILVMVYVTSLIEIRANWPLYRCNPPYWIFSEDMSADFTYCVQNTQVNLFGYLMKPFSFLLDNLSSMAGGFSNSLNSVRGVIGNVRGFLKKIVKDVFAVFSNIVIELQKFTVGIKDTMGKLIGVLVTMMYVLDGSLKTMGSAWKGPAGKMVRRFGSCFNPETKIKLKNGEIYAMKDLPLGVELEDGSVVLSVMRILNKEYFYKIKGGVNNEFIYVTGSHFIYNKILDKFVQVKDFEGSIKEENMKCECVTSLITSTHRIPIGSNLFWDWEDDELTQI